ncbi:OLC1v1003747C1 [Oldenlandia corymbosa var. corymbosa]|uniref:OLC1v1003747C1 n=1 Tax=Oldenlandia corymbosa var. corymbosa TaxID=529605 RepID=A0AAV1DAR1_OLDCO|nr:OLC1v1003747C1 [Oldenlandia corymbosa var. corymbosa]
MASPVAATGLMPFDIITFLCPPVFKKKSITIEVIHHSNVITFTITPEDYGTSDVHETISIENIIGDFKDITSTEADDVDTKLELPYAEVLKMALPVYDSKTEFDATITLGKAEFVRAIAGFTGNPKQVLGPVFRDDSDDAACFDLGK